MNISILINFSASKDIRMPFQGHNQEPYSKFSHFKTSFFLCLQIITSINFNDFSFFRWNYKGVPTYKETKKQFSYSFRHLFKSFFSTQQLFSKILVFIELIRINFSESVDRLWCLLFQYSSGVQNTPRHNIQDILNSTHFSGVMALKIISVWSVASPKKQVVIIESFLMSQRCPTATGDKNQLFPLASKIWTSQWTFSL